MLPCAGGQILDPGGQASLTPRLRGLCLSCPALSLFAPTQEFPLIKSGHIEPPPWHLFGSKLAHRGPPLGRLEQEPDKRTPRNPYTLHRGALCSRGSQPVQRKQSNIRDVMIKTGKEPFWNQHGCEGAGEKRGSFAAEKA